MPTEPAAPESSAPDAATVQNTPTADVSAIAATLTAEMPTPQPHAIAQAQAEAVAQQGKDVNGNEFNPAIHAVQADGTPRKTVGGRYALKRGKGGNQSSAGSTGTSGTGSGAPKLVIPGGSPANPANAAKVAAARAGGRGAANLLLMLCVGLGGEEWQPREDKSTGMNEKVMLEEGFGDYFVAKDMQDLPPGLALVAMFGMYALPRFRMPQTRTRMQKFRAWVGSKIGAWKANRGAKKRGVPESDVERAERDAREFARGLPAAGGGTR